MKKILKSLVVSLIVVMALCACGSGGRSSQNSNQEETVVLTAEEYKAQCKSIDYKELCRYPDQYKGEKVTVKVKVQQIMDSSSFSTKKVWRAYTDNSGYGWYMGDEYYMIDERTDDAVKILKDDVIEVYGEFAGIEKVTRALTGSNDELPKIKVEYADLVDDAPEKTYEEVFEEYSQKLQAATPQLIEQYQEEAKQNQDGITGLAKLSNDKISELANINIEGAEEMSKIYMYNGNKGSYDEYSEWTGKLTNVYTEEAGKIQDAYLESAR